MTNFIRTLEQTEAGSRKVCSAFVPPTAGLNLCKNGFHQRAACEGLTGLRMPQCLDEESCAHFFPETGRPKTLAELGIAALRSRVAVEAGDG